MSDILAGVGAALTGGLNFLSGLSTQDYQKKMQEEAWRREDTAVQRRVKDMLAAGLNPVLAAGSAASSSNPISLPVPQVDGNPVETGVNVAHTVAGKQLAEEQARLAANQRGLVQDQRAKTQQELANLQLDSATKVLTQQGMQIEQEGNQIANAERAWNLDYYKTRKLPVGQQGIVGQIASGGSMLSEMIRRLAELGGPGASAVLDAINRAGGK